MTQLIEWERYRTGIVKRAVLWALMLGAGCGAAFGTVVVPIIGTVLGGFIGALAGLALGLINALALSGAARLAHPMAAAAILSAAASGVPAFLVCPEIGTTGIGLTWRAIFALLCAAAGAALGPAVLARAEDDCRMHGYVDAPGPPR